MAKEGSIDTPTSDDLIRLGPPARARKLSNDEWAGQTDPKARARRRQRVGPISPDAAEKDRVPAAVRPKTSTRWRPAEVVETSLRPDRPGQCPTGRERCLNSRRAPPPGGHAQR